MKKLKLNLDDLRVESFDTSSMVNLPNGTVHGQVFTETCATWEDSCSPTGAFAETCWDTCTGDATADLCGGTPGCTNDTCYWTCQCADQSVEGYASCGTTCQGACATDTCDVTAYAGCEWDTGGGTTSPGAAC